MSADGRDRERELFAWLDGELGPWSRRRAARRVQRDPDLRAAARFWRRVRTLLREEVAETPAPDLWPELEARLPARAPGRPPGSAAAAPARRPHLAAWLGAGAAAAAAGLVLAVALGRSDAGPSVASLRWLDTEGKPVMVIQDDREATIIWVLEGATEQSRWRRPDAIG